MSSDPQFSRSSTKKAQNDPIDLMSAMFKQSSSTDLVALVIDEMAKQDDSTFHIHFLRELTQKFALGEKIEFSQFERILKDNFEKYMTKILDENDQVK